MLLAKRVKRSVRSAPLFGLFVMMLFLALAEHAWSITPFGRKY